VLDDIAKRLAALKHVITTNKLSAVVFDLVAELIGASFSLSFFLLLQLLRFRIGVLFCT
jgi:hypothetical protein